MAKGRKRKAGPRTRTGQLSRAGRMKDVRDVVLAQPHRRWLGARATAQEAESVIGRAYLSKLITEPEHWAAIKYRRLVDAFHVVLATPMTRQSASAIGVTASLEAPAEAEYLAAQPEEPEAQQERVLKEIKAASEALCGLSKHELDAVVLRDQAIANVPALRAALQALVWLWRLDGDVAPRRRSYWRSERPESMDLMGELG